jgi:RNA polymerase sigma-70 factor (ECF subfamily)
MAQTDLNSLLVALRAGDKGAEKKIYEHLFVRFRAIAKQRIRNASDAEDLAQEACLTVLDKCRGESFSGSFGAWAYGVLRNKIGNYYQSMRRQRETFDGGLASGDDNRHSAPAADPDLLRCLLDCLRKILAAQPRYGRALNLIYQGYSTDAASERLGVSTGNLYVILSRGRALLRKCLETGEV